MSEWVLGVLGGSGLYDLDGLENPEWVSIDTPWGKPSDDILFAEMDGVKLRFLPRHGRAHALSPSDVNYRANIDALKRAGCNLLTALLNAKSLSSVKAASPMSLWLILFVTVLLAWQEKLRKQRARLCIAAGLILRWKVRNSRPKPKAICTAHGAVMSSA